MKNYNDSFKRKIVILHLESGRSIRSFSEEFSILKSRISTRLVNTKNNDKTETKAKYDLMR